METLGSYLREEREKQGKTLKQIAEKTCISRTTLHALEDDREDQLPPASYLRGFLKLYALELGLNTEELLERLPQQEPEPAGLTLPPAPDLETKKKPWLKIALITGIICIACIWAWKMFFGIAPVSQDTPAQIVSPRPALPDVQTAAPVLQNTPGQPDILLDEPEPEAETLPEAQSAAKAQPADTPRPEKNPPVTSDRFPYSLPPGGLSGLPSRAITAPLVVLH